MSFKFNFDLDEEEVDQTAGPSRVPTSAPVNASPPDSAEAVDARCHHCSLQELLDELPESIAYAPLHLDFLSTPILRRDLHDARFQLAAAADDGAGEALDTAEGPTGDRTGKKTGEEEYVDAETDLIPNVYEGGLKTWEGGVDLVQVLSDVQGDGAAAWLKGKRSLEVGCGTALPTCYLLSHLLDPASPPSPSFTTLHVQDYNRPVLSLVSLPNILLAALPHLPVEALRSADEAGDIEDVVIDYEHGGDIAVTPELKAAFVQLLKDRNVQLQFTYGHWAGLASEIEQDIAAEGAKKGYELVLTAETIYSEDSVDSLIKVLRAASSAPKGEKRGEHKEAQVNLEDSLQGLGVQDGKQGQDGKLQLTADEGVILVAAKVLYFGVGGGLQDFIQRIEEGQGWAVIVREWVKGVGRRVVRIGW